MLKSFKYRLRPTKKQEKILLAHIEECRLLYNQLVCARIQAWQQKHQSLSCYDQIKTIPLMKKQRPEFTQKNRRLSKSISDAAWSLFRHCLSYKAEEAGIGFKAVDPEYTSQDCSACGHREKKALCDRVHHCKKCGYTADRDLNAAINILTLGLQSPVA